jgi:REP element-mobilizing transposase RayT
MSYVRVWIHAVWGTKNREHVLTREIRPTVVEHIKENAKNKCSPTGLNIRAKADWFVTCRYSAINGGVGVLT